MILEKMLEIARDDRYGPAELWRFSEIVVSRTKDMLNPDVPRQVKGEVSTSFLPLNYADKMLTAFFHRFVQRPVVRAEQGVPPETVDLDGECHQSQL